MRHSAEFASRFPVSIQAVPVRSARGCFVPKTFRVVSSGDQQCILDTNQRSPKSTAETNPPPLTQSGRQQMHVEGVDLRVEGDPTSGNRA